MTPRKVHQALASSVSRARRSLHCLALILIFISALALTCAAVAQTSTPLAFHLDPASTNIHWTLNTTIHTVHGTFRLKAGERSSFKIDPATGDASGLIVIDAASGESGDSARDNRMHTTVLESAQYPLITFRPTHVDGIADGKIDLAAGGTVTVSGFLNLHGQDHPLKLTVNLQPKGTAAGLTTHFTVPFVAWGLKDPSSFIFRTDKEVILDVDAIAIHEGPVARAILRPSEMHTGR
jgi:polyisoprenoid-binding protein YceI